MPEALGALVIGVLILAGISVSVGTAHNYSQDEDAQSVLHAVKSAETLHQVKTNNYGNVAALTAGTDPALSTTPDNLVIEVSDEGLNYCAMVTSTSMSAPSYWLTSRSGQVSTSAAAAETVGGLAADVCPISTVVRTNRLLNPTPIVGVSGWNSNDGTKWTVAKDTSTVRRPGSVSSRQNKIMTENSTVIGSWYSVGAIGWSKENSPLVTPGETISISSYWFTGTPNARARIGYVFFNDAEDRIIEKASPYQSGVGGQWHRAGIENIIVPPGATNVRIGFDVVTADGLSSETDFAFIQDAQMESGPRVTPFVSGDLADENGFRYDWLGEEGRSASTGNGDLH
jgi:hypothetical protein